MTEPNGRGPRVDLIDWTPHPLETIYAIWHASRTDAETLRADEVALELKRSRGITGNGVVGRYYAPPHFYIGPVPMDMSFHEYYLREVTAIAHLDFPLKETVGFTFAFSNVPITWREQAVRQRRAVSWSQTSRTRDLSNFYDKEYYDEPASIQADPELHKMYHGILARIQDFYREAVRRGVHREDARCLQPTSQTHRIVQHYDARTLEATLEDRICFIAQAELWRPVIEQIRAHLVAIDPLLSVLFHPPCVHNGEYKFCPVQHENERRMDGRDPMGPCPLWVLHEYGVTAPDDVVAFKSQWGDVPHRENAEEQFARVKPLWGPALADPVQRYIDGARETSNA